MDETDWQMNKKLDECNKHIFENELFYDVEFRVGAEGEPVRAHRLILASRSPVFERMFFGSLPEKKGSIVIPDVEPAPFKALLRYCYFESINIDPENALSTLYAAKKYMLPLLETACRDIQVENLTADNIWGVYTSSMTNPDEKLHASCREYFTKSITNVSTALKSPEFLNTPCATLLDLLQVNDTETDDGLQVILIAEIELFKACNAWAEAECLRQELDPSGPNKRCVLGDCLFQLRFPVMLPSDIVNIVSPTGILTVEEKNNVFEKDNAVVQPLLMFPSREHTVRVDLNTFSEYNRPFLTAFGLRDTSYRDTLYNITKQGMNPSVSLVEVQPKNSLTLVGLMHERRYHRGENMVQIEIAIIKMDDKHVNFVCGKTVLPMCIKDGESLPFAYLPIEPNVSLEASFVYSIRVSCNERLSTKPVDIEFPFVVRTPAQINLDVVDDSQNGAIGALFFHLK